MVFNKTFVKQEQTNEQILKSLIYPSHHRHDWCHYFSAILSHLYGKSFGLRYFSWMAEGDWYLECGGSGHPPCR